ncbi:transposase [Leptolyngbya sp. GGD]|uniref:transposase n=1 Tax=Leptolyngbya sp. GGD TaxID=2997907 RepID=UPI00227D51CD|nr:transposase [Leptolyngbya sp. GGD]MCY6493874.1 transposase [Leptolyngbya sp. GGD]
METIVGHAQSLVYSLLCLMPSAYQKASLNALFGLFLEALGHPLPQSTQVKSASSLSRFLNHYAWSTRSVIRVTRQAIFAQLSQYRPRQDAPLRVLIDLTTLEKCGKFLHLSTPTENPDAPDPWVRMLNGKRGLHLVVLYLNLGQWRIPWSFRVWRGKGKTSPAQLACRLLATVPKQLVLDAPVIVLADTEFGTIEFLRAVNNRGWRAVVGVRCTRKLQDGSNLKQLYRRGKRGTQIKLEGIPFALTVSWFWLKQASGKRELRFVVSTYPYSGVYLVRLGRKRWAIEAFFKTIKHRFGLHRFGQSTKLGVYRWLVLVLIAYLLVHWVHQSTALPQLDWKTASDLAMSILFASVLWFQLLRHLRKTVHIAAHYHFEIVLKSLPNLAYQEWCKI